MTNNKPVGIFGSKRSWIRKLKDSWTGFAIVQMLAVLFFGHFLININPSLRNLQVYKRAKASSIENLKQLEVDEKLLKVEIRLLQRKIDKLTPGGVYLIINTSDNTFSLYQKKELIREGICSTGSYIRLETEDEKNWIFETPKGVFTIKGKTTDPVWRKPDWAFVEEGLPIPPVGDPSRYEYGVLGDYALALGDGYLIHGTLYKRFLGLPVTHGCVRMGDEDLEAVYSTLPLGAKVFIY